MKFKSIEEVDIRDKRVFIRVDFNVPITRDGDVADDARIKAVLPTIRHAIKEKAKVIIASHLGRPGGKHVRRLSIEPVGRRLSELLNKEIFFPEDCVGDAVKKIAIEMPSGAVMLLENLRFHRGEEENDPSFAKKLSGVVDVYVNEAFSVSQRAHASIVGILDFVEVACVGFVFGREVQYLGRLLGDPERPFVAILGGRSASQKIPIMETLLGRLNTILIGGATAFTFLKAMGKEIGKSLLDTSALYSAQRLLKSAKIRDVKISLLGSTSPKTCETSFPPKHLTTCTMASTSRMCARNLFPNPSPLLAPFTKPAMSMNLRVAGIIFSGFIPIIRASLVSLSSGTSTTPVLGSIVVNG